MELSQRAIEEVIHPTAAFLQTLEENEAQVFSNRSNQNYPSPLSDKLSWERSLLNPKNRIDSLELPDKPLWRIDGCAGLGTQYYAVPIFLSKVPPMRMDVFISDDQPTVIREQLDLNIAFHTKDATRLPRLAIARHIVRALQHWTTSRGWAYLRDPNQEDFKQFYRSVPFGSRIVFEGLSLNICDIRIKIAANHDLERRLLSLSSLRALWGPHLELPETVDFFDVHVVTILHDSVCLVRIHGQLYIYKALVSGVKHLYHELKTLCTLVPHPNIIVRPIHIVQKACAFGRKKAVVGFTTFYHPRGTLRDLLPQLRIHGRLRLQDQLKWSIELTEALDHIHTTSGMYYPDLRLDNILLSEESDITMVDFEQRGVWCEFASPEINAIEYIRLLAMGEHLQEHVRARYPSRLKKLVPDFSKLVEEEGVYRNPEQGHNVAWIALSTVEREAAEVFMLGRVLWCIFEGVSGPQKAASWQSYRWEPDLDFPEYDRTPPAMRILIDQCTKGRRATLNRTIVRQHSRLVVLNKPLEQQSVEDVKAAAKFHWSSELEAAESYLDLRESLQQQGRWNGNHYNRPTLKEVLASLKTYRQQVEQLY